MSEQTTRASQDGPLASQEWKGNPEGAPHTTRSACDDLTVLEKSPEALTEKYANYAGEAPDGGLKAWSGLMNQHCSNNVFGVRTRFGIFFCLFL
ncbi:hypothetical protein HYDPIDRAFT_118172 [Hydnomerulius pinastri MD-312]|uniref:Uncharacterized protein n=1 Tax=Hydnomerulius pinastri MD-312 TaxID=994086 RepID=A0A0C9W9S4_9AGAM|nr:hypothetical protein HYDPIDRAFT_118172 [Hydnomerulius pinastri MD-312]